MDLRSWLESKAGLSGRALLLAVDACEANVIDTIADLRIAAKNETEYEKIFPQGGIRSRISAGFTASSDDDQISASPPPQSSDEQPKVYSSITKRRKDPFLPEGKR